MSSIEEGELGDELRGDSAAYDFSQSALVPFCTLHMRLNVLAGLGGLNERISADQDPTETEVVRLRIGRSIQSEVRAYVRALFTGRSGIFDSRGEHVQRISVGNGLVLDLDDVDLYRSPRLRWGHEVGNPPLNPDEWLRNARGILRAVSRIRR